MRTLRTAAAYLGLVGLGVLSACGGGGGSPSASTPASAGDQAMVNYVQCMRHHGIDFPDPNHRAGHAGITLNFPSGSIMATTAYGDAQNACGQIIEPLVDEKQAGAASRARLTALIKYSRCMRDHQIPLLDPDPTDAHISLGNVRGLSEPAGGRQGAQFRAADQACRHLLPADTPDDGTGPP